MILKFLTLDVEADDLKKDIWRYDTKLNYPNKNLRMCYSVNH